MATAATSSTSSEDKGDDSHKIVRSVPRLKLNTGYEIPSIGFGTSFPAEYKRIEFLVEKAIEHGYRYFDIMHHGFNQERIGRAIERKISSGEIKRRDLFIAAKLWITERDPDTIVKTCLTNIKRMEIDYFDLFLIDWPFSNPAEVDFIDVWIAMENCVNFGLTRSIGVSNFSIKQLHRLIEDQRTTIVPAVMQIEMHLYLNQDSLIRYCRSKDIQVVAHSPFGAPDRSHLFRPRGRTINFNDERIEKISQKYEKTPYQIALRYCIDQGVIPLPKTYSEDHLQENLDVFDFKLTDDEIAVLKTLNCGLRTCTAEMYSAHQDYPFQE